MLKKIFPENSPVQLHHLLFFSLLIALMPRTGFWYDLQDWARWSVFTYEHGLSKVYDSDTNYVPFYPHLLYWFGQLQGSVAAIKANIYQIKFFFLPFDFAGAIAVAYACRKYSNIKFAEYYLLFNIAYLYETVIWCQLDSLPTTLAVLSILCLFQNRLLWGVAFATWALYAKLQAIIFVPFFCLFLGYHLYKKMDISLIIKMIAVSLAVQLYFVTPFIIGGTFSSLLKVVRESVGFFPRVSWSAYNLWTLILPEDINLGMLPDSQFFHGLTYKHWGFLLFFGLSFLAFLPLISKTLHYMKNKIELDKNHFALTFLTAGLISVLFFFVNTQMHERYAYPALIFFFGYGLVSNHYALYVLTSVAYLMNVDAIFQYLHVAFVSPQLVALLFALILLVAFVKIYRDFSFKNDWRSLFKTDNFRF